MSKIHDQILDVLKQHPDGISVNEVRRKLGLAADEQQHLDRRIRDLDTTYDIERVRDGDKILYIFHGAKDNPVSDDPVDKTTRARILIRDNSRCQMCGKTPAVDHVRLHIDHRVPRDWGGSNEDKNLWTLCSKCNEGKRNFYKTITDENVQKAMLHEEIWVRLGELLKAKAGQFVEKGLLATVAYSHDDWEKRLRELRVLGWDYETRKHGKKGERVRVEFRLIKSQPWPVGGSVGAEIRRLEAINKKGKQSTTQTPTSTSTPTPVPPPTSPAVQDVEED